MNFKDIAATLRKSGYSPKKADAKIAHDIVLKAIEDAGFRRWGAARILQRAIEWDKGMEVGEGRTQWNARFTGLSAISTR